jgi:NitT/TauT family transport system permease protein
MEIKNILGGNAPKQIRKVWGEATALLTRYQKLWWVDVSLVLGLIGLIFGITTIASEWTGQQRAALQIDLSPWALPKYTFFSLCRGLMAYGLSLFFTLGYGYWAAKDHRAEKILIPLLDIGQSIPVLSIMPGLVLAMVALFPNNNVGLELASVITIFDGQVWNMTFSFYQSLRSIPQYLQEAAAVYQFNWWQRAKKLELPFSAIGLIWNSMMSMAGGWFFLMLSESFQMKDKDFRLPGLGSYMSAANDQDNWVARGWAILAMAVMVIMLDQLLWRPLVVWGQKFRVEEGGAEEGMHSWVLDLIKRSQILQFLQKFFKPKPTALVPQNLGEGKGQNESPMDSSTPSDTGPRPVSLAKNSHIKWLKALSTIAFVALVSSIGYGAWKVIELFSQIHLQQWITLLGEAAVTLARVLAAVGLSVLWTVPVGLMIGLSPRLSRILQPVIQVVASFPAPMLFFVVILAMKHTGITLAWSSIFLMILGTQWYILFNVVAGAMAIPSDLREAAELYRIRGWQRFWKVYLPGVFPYLVTGMVTATGNAWNTTIVAEYYTDKNGTLTTWGLGSQITDAAAREDFPMLAASVVVMSLVVVIFNRLVWKRLYRLAEEKYSLSK